VVTQSYILNFQRAATEVADGLRQRGFHGGLRDDEEDYLYRKRVTDDLALKLLFTKKGDTLGEVGLLLGSLSINRVMHSLGLFIDERIPPIGEHQTVVAVDLIWLRGNHSPERASKCKYDYTFGIDNHAVQRFFEDLDTVGQDFVNGVSSPRAMADLLAGLDKYPCRIEWGGKPVSVRPYIYAAIFYMELGDNARAKEVLDEGWRKYQTPAPRQYYQSIRLKEYQTRRLLLLRHMGMTETVGK
jgi:hypothetical protein